MEEVDAIIIPILGQIGCKLDKKSIAEFEAEDVFHVSVMCLKTINPDTEYTTKLPPGKAPRFRLTSNLSNEIKDMGFMGEMGYQTFLYPTEVDTRKLLRWLVEKLPKKEDEEGEQEVLGADAQLAQDIMSGLRAWGKTKWNPLLYCTDANTKQPLESAPLCLPTSSAPKAVSDYYKKYQPVVSQQPQCPEVVPPSLLELNTLEVVKGKELEAMWGDENSVSEEQKQAFLQNIIGNSLREAIDAAVLSTEMGSANRNIYGGAFSRRTEFEQDKSTTGAQVVSASGAVQNVGGEKAEDEDEIKEQREKELAALQEELKNTQDKLTRMSEEIERNISTTRQLEAELTQLKAEIKQLEQQYKLKRDTLALLPNADANLKSLAKLGADKSKSLLALNKEWEQVRMALVTKYRKKKQLLQERKADVGRKVNQIKRMRVEMKQKAEMIRQKDKLYKQVAEELRKLPKSVNRQEYVRRIMDIVKNLDKQKTEIKKILVDVRRVQRDINQMEKTSQRSFAMADQVVYQKADQNREDDAFMQAFKNVVALREGFTSLVDKVEETGKLKSEYSDLNQQMDALAARNQDMNTSKLEKDLEAVKEENTAMLKKLKKLKAQG